MVDNVCKNCYWFLTDCNNCGCTLHYTEPSWLCENLEEFGAVFTPIKDKTFEQEANEWWEKHGEESLARMKKERIGIDSIIFDDSESYF